MRCWGGYLSGARCRLFAYGPANATAIPKSHYLLPHLNPDWFYLSGTGLPRWSWKRPSNGCSSSSSSVVVVKDIFRLKLCSSHSYCTGMSVCLSVCHILVVGCTCTQACVGRARSLACPSWSCPVSATSTTERLRTSASRLTSGFTSTRSAGCVTGGPRARFQIDSLVGWLAGWMID